jgi:hypothetical protein
VYTAGTLSYWSGFGELAEPSRVDDQYATLVAGVSSPANFTSNNQSGITFPVKNTSTGLNSNAGYVLRNMAEQAGAPTQYALMGHGRDQNCIGQAVVLAYPNTPDNGFYVAPVSVIHENALRARMPGMYESLHGPAGGLVSDWSEFDGNIIGLEGRKIRCFRARCWDQIGLLAFDLTGPWR